MLSSVTDIMEKCLKEISYQNRYEFWVLRLYESMPAIFDGIDESPRSISGFPEYVTDYLRCPGCGSPLVEISLSMTHPSRHGGSFLYLSRCSCGKIVTVENYIDYGEEVPWPDNSGLPPG